MKVLLDTCVISELYKSLPTESVRDAINNLVDENIYISVITLGEINKGIALLPESERKRSLIVWLVHLEQKYSDRILPITTETSMLWGHITAMAQQKGFILHTADGLIAATALQHNLYLMTRNSKDFEPAHVRIIYPWL